MSDNQRRLLSAELGKSPDLAILETFALHPATLLSAADITSLSGVAWATVHRRMAEWLPKRFVVRAGKDGKAVLYKINDQSPAMRALMKALRAATRELFQSSLISEGMHEAEFTRQAVVLIDKKDTSEIFWHDGVDERRHGTRVKLTHQEHELA